MGSLAVACRLGTGFDVAPAPPPIPDDFDLIFGAANIFKWFDSQHVQASGTTVTGATDRGSVPSNWVPNNGVTLVASDPLAGGIDTPSIQMTGATSFMANDTGRPANGQAFYRFSVVNLASWTSNRKVITAKNGANGSGFTLVQSGAISGGGGGIATVNDRGSNACYGLPTSRWGLIIERYGSNKTKTDPEQCYIQALGCMQAGVDTGLVKGTTGCSFGRGAGDRYKLVLGVEGSITPLQMQAALARIRYLFGPGVIYPQPPSDVIPIIMIGQSQLLSQGTTGVGPGITPEISMSVVVKDSESADSAAYPSILRQPGTVQIVAPVGHFGPEQQSAVALKAASKTKYLIIKFAVGATNVAYQLTGAGSVLFAQLMAEMAPLIANATQAFGVIMRYETDCVEGMLQAAATSTCLQLFDQIRSFLPPAAAANCHMLVDQVHPSMTFGTSFIAGVNAGLTAACAADGNAEMITTSDIDVTGWDGKHIKDAGINVIGDRHAARYIALTP